MLHTWFSIACAPSTTTRWSTDSEHGCGNALAWLSHDDYANLMLGRLELLVKTRKKL
jgi:hypothetical protein